MFHLAPGMWDPKDNDGGGSGKARLLVTEVMELKENKCACTRGVLKHSQRGQRLSESRVSPGRCNVSSIASLPA